MPDAPPARRFAVRRVNWHADSLYGDDPYFRRLPTTVTEATFPDADAAYRDRDRREADARGKAKQNPFLYGGGSLFYQTSFPAEIFHDWLLDRDIPPPGASPNVSPADWQAWWDALAPDLRPIVWEALDKVRFFEVAEDSPTKAYVVMELNWRWNSQPWLEADADADAEGGKPVRAFRSRKKADARCEQLNRDRRADGNYQSWMRFSIENRTGRKSDVVRPVAETDFFEVVEVDLAAGSSS